MSKSPQFLSPPVYGFPCIFISDQESLNYRKRIIDSKELSQLVTMGVGKIKGRVTVTLAPYHCRKCTGFHLLENNRELKTSSLKELVLLLGKKIVIIVCQGEGGIYGERNTEIHISICKIDSQWEFAV